MIMYIFLILRFACNVSGGIVSQNILSFFYTQYLQGCPFIRTPLNLSKEKVEGYAMCKVRKITTTLGKIWSLQVKDMQVDGTRCLEKSTSHVGIVRPLHILHRSLVETQEV